MILPFSFTTNISYYFHISESGKVLSSPSVITQSFPKMNSEDANNLSLIKNDIEKNKLGSNSLLFSKKNVTFISKI